MDSDHRPLTREQDWPFFDAGCGFTPSERERIHPFTEAAAKAFWSAHVSPHALERHSVLLPPGHWLDQNMPGPDWFEAGEDEARSRARAAGLAQFLSGHFALDSSAEVFFALMKESVYSVPFGLFIAHCEDFLLLDDERPFLIDLASGAFALFGPNGQVHVGFKADAN